MSSRQRKGQNKSRQVDSGVPGIYPAMPGYPMPTQWIPPPSSTVTTYPYQWYQPWTNMPPMSSQSASWLPTTTTVITTTQDTPVSKSGSTPGAPDEFRVDSLRRVYNNDDGSIEIERVKVLRRQGIYGTSQTLTDYHPENKSLVPVSPNALNERRPPPRKHKKKSSQVPVLPDKQGLQVPGWYPYMPYMPQPFPYPYPYGYVWPMPHPASVVSPGYQSMTDESEGSVSRQETFPVSLESPDLTLDKSRSPELQRPSSSAATSQVTESLGTDIAPSDSVSMRGFKREPSLERLLRKSLPGKVTTSTDRPTSSDMEKTREWMEDMQRAFDSKSALPSDITGDRSSFATATSDIPGSPTRDKVNKSLAVKMSRRKSNSESNIDNQEDHKSLASLPLLDSTRVSDSDLIYAFKKLEDASNVFKAHATPDVPHKDTCGSVVKRKKTFHATDDRGSRTSTLSFHSTRQSADEHFIDTDSTDIAILMDSSTADESADNYCKKGDDDDNNDYKWVLMRTKDTVENLQLSQEQPDDFIENWRTEVSLWRARLVVSLCRGEGLDQQDWATFQLLVQHPLPMNLKLSLLHAHRLCSRNYDVGVAMLRNSLLHLTTFGESLMKPEKERPTGWKTVATDPDQPWAPVKGSLEILRVFGFCVKEGTTLKYKRKMAPEVSVIARLTLDLLVLAEEFRLFLNGSHQYPTNITQLFTPRESHSEKHSASLRQSEKPVYITQDSNHQNYASALEGSVGGATEEIETCVDQAAVIDNNYDKNTEQLDTGQQQIVPLAENGDSIIDSSNQPISPQLTDIPSSSSLPDLHSHTEDSKDALDGKQSESRETLTPTKAVEVCESEQIASTEDAKISASNEEKSITMSGENDKRCNPEDHIYEEIGETKAQVEALKGQGSLPHSPPPLPPKTKGSNSSQDFYPHMEWSISSQYSSIHGGSMARRKKRRAPRPPDTESQSTEKDTKVSSMMVDNSATLHVDNKERLEEMTSKNNPEANPFLEEIRPIGYIGKNPFYEGFDFKTTNKTLKKEPNENDVNIIDDNQLDTLTREESMEDISVISEISVSDLPAGVRPRRRRRGKSSTFNKIPVASVTFEQKVSNDDGMSSEQEVPASVVTSKQSDKENIPKGLESLSKNQRGKTKDTKNEEREQQWKSQAAVSSSPIKTGVKLTDKNKKIRKKDVIVKTILITYDINLGDSSVLKEKDLKEKTLTKHIVKNKEPSTEASKKDEKKSILGSKITQLLRPKSKSNDLEVVRESTRVDSKKNNLNTKYINDEIQDNSKECKNNENNDDAMNLQVDAKVGDEKMSDEDNLGRGENFIDEKNKNTATESKGTVVETEDVTRKRELNDKESEDTNMSKDNFIQGTYNVEITTENTKENKETKTSTCNKEIKETTMVTKENIKESQDNVTECKEEMKCKDNIEKTGINIGKNKDDCNEKVNDTNEELCVLEMTMVGSRNLNGCDKLNGDMVDVQVEDIKKSDGAEINKNVKVVATHPENPDHSVANEGQCSNNENDTVSKLVNVSIHSIKESYTSDPSRDDQVCKSSDLLNITEETSNLKADAGNKQYSKDVTEPPPLPPPKAALRLFDDIPYIDTNDVRNYKDRYSTSEGKQPPHYGLTEIQAAVSASESLISGMEDKTSSFLKRSSLVPYIDDSDVPPESPPPPPPIPPPSTPPLILSDSTSSPITPASTTSLILSVVPLNPASPPTPPTSTSPHDSLIFTTPFIHNHSNPPTPPSYSPPPSPVLKISSCSVPPLASDSEQSSSQGTVIFRAIPEKGNTNGDGSLLSIQKITSSGSTTVVQDAGKEIQTEEINLKDLNHKDLNVASIQNSAPENVTMDGSETIFSEDLSNRKSTILFGSEAKPCTQEHCFPSSEVDGYEIPEQLNSGLEVEDGYEIPDVSRAPANMSFINKNVRYTEPSNKRKQGQNGKEDFPKPPPRHQQSFRVPPPRPPKPADVDSPPKLPPKTGSFKSSSGPSDFRQITASLPSTLVRVSGCKTQIHDRDSSSQTTNTLPSTSVSLKRNANQAFSPSKALSLSSIPTDSVIKSEPSVSSPTNDSESVPKDSTVKSVSVPCSPKVRKIPRKLSREDKKRQRSWPFLLCDCVHPTENQDDIKYVVK